MLLGLRFVRIVPEQTVQLMIDFYLQIKLVRALLEQDIIEHSISEFCSTKFWFEKQNSESFRPLINYGELHTTSKIETEDYPFGSIHDCYQYLHDARF